MKKTITINLAGVVFHIEEDAFEQLQSYLNSIRQYFSKFKGGIEIQGDIELRIAEIFSEAISKSKQAITQEDVENLVRQMGKVEEMADDLDLEIEPDQEKEKQNQTSGSKPFEEPKKLVRDKSNAIIAGVCSGIAIYFEVNPLWIRLAVAALAFGIFLLPSFFWTIFIGYIILWIAMPGASGLVNRGQYKKFFRSRKDKIVGGLAAGLGKYTSIDPVIIRILFILTMFMGGFGLILYLILWAITPQAKTITDELQMEGEPVTLNNIEEQIKKNINVSDPETKKTLTRVATFPIRILELLIQAFGRVLKIGFDISRAILGVILLFLSGLGLFSIIIVLLAALGILDQATYHIQTGDFPIGKIANEISPWMVGFAGMTAIVPAIFILLVALSLLANKNMLKAVVLLTLFSIFLIGSLGSAITIIPLIHSFSTQGTYTVNKEFAMPSKLMTISINELNENNWGNRPVGLELEGTEGGTVKLTEQFNSHGKDRREANDWARQIQYNAIQQDSSLILDSQFSLESNVPFRLQHVKLKLAIPYGQNFKLDAGLEKMLENFNDSDQYEDSSLEGNVWMFTKDGLKCLTCTPKTESDEEDF
jgi:phage shock protein PspC (stress-responsive transcriptional regulator)